MFKLAIILLFGIIAGDRNRSLAGIPKSGSPWSQWEDVETRCNGYCFSTMRSMMDFVAANQDQWNTCKAIVANDTRPDLNQMKVQLSGLQESVTRISKDFEEWLGRLDSQLVAIKEILTSSKTLPESMTRIPPPNFVLIGSRYFYIEQNIKLDWHGAAQKCREMGGHLATFKDEEEMLFIKPKRSSTSHYWLGINCLHKKYDHISLASGKPAVYFNWKPNEPIINDEGQRCVAINDDSGMYYIECTRNYHFICQADDEF